MKIVLFYPSMLSEWNQGHVHFIRGVANSLQARGHQVKVYEPREGASLQTLLKEQGPRALLQFQKVFPDLESMLYDPARLDLPRVLEGVQLVIANEANAPELIASLDKRRGEDDSFRLFLHDTGHRSVTDPDALGRLELSHFDGVLAFGQAVRDIYIDKRWADRVWVWHEAADTRVFKPLSRLEVEGDLAWVGNYGDDERTAELKEFLFEPVRELGLRTLAHGVGFPAAAVRLMKRAGIRHGGWIANHRVPWLFSQYRCTVHVPRRPYVEQLPGIPSLRMFEAMACGLPLVCSPWEDAEHLFIPGKDYLVARDKREMKEHLRNVLHDEALARRLAMHARWTIQERHTCAHRADELLRIGEELGLPPSGPAARRAGTFAQAHRF
jgi:spore maturation protein CgeB